MSEGTPLQRIPRSVIPRKLAHSGLCFQGLIRASDLPRLTASVVSVGEVLADVEFAINDEGKMVVIGWAKAELVLECQRCMAPMAPTVLEAEIHVAIVRDEDEAKQLLKSLDPWVVPEDEADLYALIEDELLLTIPVVAYHDEACIDQSLLSAGEDIEG